VGVDFAEDMIVKAGEKAKFEGLPNAVFERSSIFDFDFSSGPYDVISANGFIEYISQDELRQFIEVVSAALAPGGSFVVGSRNRLFNLFTLNSFTQMELEGSNLESLIHEAIALASGATMEDLAKVKTAPLQKPDTEHAITGIGVKTRFQYTPLQILQMLKEWGFNVVEICPVHIHGVPPIFKDSHPEVHTSISNLLQSYGRKHMEFITAASTFMTHAVKGEV